MDFHSAMVSPQDEYRSIAPGQTSEFDGTLKILLRLLKVLEPSPRRQHDPSACSGAGMR